MGKRWRNHQPGFTPTPPRSAPDEGWRLDRHVPITLLIAIGIQTISMIWYIAKLDSRVGDLEIRTAPVLAYSERLVKLESKMESSNDRLTEIRDALKGRTRTANAR